MAHVSVQTIELPSIDLTKSASKSHAHRVLVHLALNKSLLPIIPDKTTTMNIHIHPDIHAKLQKVADTHGLTLSTAFAAMENAGFQFLNATTKSDDKKRKELKDGLTKLLLVADHEESRPEQHKFWLNLSTGLTLNKVVMAEASTGVGKGRGIVSAAILTAKQGKKPVIIAAPTIQTLEQLWEEYLKPCVQLEASNLNASFLPGKQEFVDDLKLRLYLDSIPTNASIEAIEKWMEQGAKSECGSALSSSATNAGINPCWLVADLREIAEGSLKAEDFAITEDSSIESKGMEQHAIFKESAANADIVFMTQAMLARLSIQAWTMLPQMLVKDTDSETRANQPVILIDEAHLFEQTMAAAASDSMSLHSLRFRLANKMKEVGASSTSAIGQSIKTVNKLMDLCRKSYSGDEIILKTGIINDSKQTNHVQLISEITAHLNGLSALLAKRGDIQHVKNIDEDKKTIAYLIKALIEQINSRCMIEFSPHVNYPSFLVGPPNVKGKLASVWSTATGGVGLVSATFWLPSWDGTFRADYMRDVLNLPIARVDTPAPVEWKVIYSTPIRYLPESIYAKELTPPVGNDDSAEKLEAWCQAQAKQITAFTSTSKGGTLVLCTSYVQIKSLSKHLETHGIDPERIIVNSGRLADDKKKFIETYNKGLRPLWLVLGPGWTGVDLVQHDPVTDKVVNETDDYLLTDLIITRLPFGLNRTTTKIIRMEQNFKSSTYEALLLLKQGLGRLIRRKGLEHRRILILDGRLLQTNLHPFMAQAVKDVYLLIGKYLKKQTFSIGANPCTVKTYSH